MNTEEVIILRGNMHNGGRGGRGPGVAVYKGISLRARGVSCKRGTGVHQTTCELFQSSSVSGFVEKHGEAICAPGPEEGM